MRENSYTIALMYAKRLLDPPFPHRGKIARARKAPYGSWRHSQFKSACSKAAKIMEDR